MKTKSMRTPNLQEIFSQKNQYEQHKRKLHRIYQQRKSQLGYDSLRMRDFDHIKENKTKSFISKFNQKSDSIAKENIKFLGKLQNVKPSLSRRSVSEQRERYTYSYINPRVKQQMLDTQKQNLRISSRMRNMSSSLNQKSFMRDYGKSQQIKNRLMRYAVDNQNSKVCLKSQRYLNKEGENMSVLSQSKQGRQQSKKGFKVVKVNHRKSAISHYKKQQILKNKVDVTSNLAAIKDKNKYRPNTSFQGGKNPEQNSFFTTEPRRERPYFKKRNIN